MTSTAGFAFFVLSAAFALLGALGTVLAKKPLRAAMALLTHVISLAGLYLVLHAQFLAAIQMLVYAGAIVVLFVFVIMLIGPDASEQSENTRSFSSALAALTVAVPMLMTALAVKAFAPEALALPEGYGTVKGVGRALFDAAYVPFELISVTLVVAIVGTIAVARGRTKDEAEALRTLKAERAAEAEARKAEFAACEEEGGAV